MIFIVFQRCFNDFFIVFHCFSFIFYAASDPDAVRYDSFSKLWRSHFHKILLFMAMEHAMIGFRP